ncbi:MAG: hypothetical protein U9Q06_00035 [Nanoarchaeota archaeon]|nr:hypothetical protein [Nanoarchaeota archaeon]
MHNPDYIRKQISPEQVAEVLNLVHQNELTDLVWSFNFHREISPERLKEGVRQLQRYLFNAEDLAKDAGLRMRYDALHTTNVKFDGILDVRTKGVYLDADAQILFQYADTSKLVGAGLVNATARLPTTDREMEPELHMWTNSAKTFWLHVPNKHYVHNPASERDSSAPLWLPSNTDDQSTQYCDKLNEMLKDVNLLPLNSVS